MDVVVSVCIVTRILQVLMYGMYECFGMQMLGVVSCEHPVTVLNAAYYITFSLLMLVEDERGDHM